MKDKITTKKLYNNVADMVRDLSEDKAQGERTAKKIEERTIINFLMALRAASGLSQSEIAAKMGCTQSKISKLEGGKDEELSIGDFHGYADALGLPSCIGIDNKNLWPGFLRMQ